MLIILRLLSTLSYLVDFYILLISLRILLSWFGTRINTRLNYILGRITDPYLNIFRKITFLRLGFINLSVLLGIYLLLFISQLLKVFGLGQISLRIVLIVFVQLTLGAIVSILTILCIILIVRLIVFLLSKASVEIIAQHIDSFLHPLVMRIIRKLPIKGSISYKAELIIILVLLALAIFLVQLLTAVIINLLGFIPF